MDSDTKLKRMWIYLVNHTCCGFCQHMAKKDFGLYSYRVQSVSKSPGKIPASQILQMFSSMPPRSFAQSTFINSLVKVVAPVNKSLGNYIFYDVAHEI